ncbi:MAG: replication-associated recombination protein A [Candidatus Tantalella remota]|nr:replication-associated recombination protein A [Candidatus Tantalella remota]
MDLEKKHPKPLSLRRCPGTLEDFYGQKHIIGDGMLLKRAIEADRLSSLIFYGPPGTGKTALATVISKRTGAEFMKSNAVSSNVKEIRDVIDIAGRTRKLYERRTILLLDEIHRFNKAQQDVLMPAVEEGILILIGTTTENPFFSVNAALLSRSQVFEFKPLDEIDVRSVVTGALADNEKGLGLFRIKITDEAIGHLAKIARGDARKALNALELAALTTPQDKDGFRNITLKEAEESIQKKAVLYDKAGDAHYDTKSAYIKSIRGSDPDAALYWLAKMIVAGEDPRVISRRLLISASEDVGNADPQALLVANAAMQAADFIGFPEARIPLAQATIYVACAPKSNASYLAIESAMEDISEGGRQEVPNHLKDTHYAGAKQLGRGEGYKYAHSYDGHYVKQEYMNEKKKYYIPTQMGFEKKIKEWMENLEKMSGNNGRNETKGVE